MTTITHIHYRKRGSASYVVRQWLLWVVVVVVVQRERERETPVTSLISRWNREWSCIWLPCWRVDHTGEVQRSPEPSARPSVAADCKKRQICTTCLFAESVGMCLCFLPSCVICKYNAVGNVVAETGRYLWVRHDWPIFQCHWKVRFDAHLNSLHGSR